MPSKTDFNVSPYYDDFDKDKKFHRVMYRPAFAVQARELTTQQSILQNQIELLGDSMYKHGSMVIPGEATFDLNHFSVKLTSFTGTLANLEGTVITGGTSGATAKVLAYDTANAIVSLINVVGTFAVGETITGGSSTATAAIDTGGVDGGDLNRYTGDILYVEYRRPITRAADQIEDIKLIVEF